MTLTKDDIKELSKIVDELDQIRLEIVNGYDGYALERIEIVLQTLRANEQKK